MIHTMRIRLLTPMLGSRSDPTSKIQLFPRAACGGVAFTFPIWSWGLNNAARHLGLENFDDESIRPGRTWHETPRVVLYNRTYTKANKPVTQTFESFPEGSTLVAKIFLAQPHRGVGGKAVDIDTMTSLICDVGEYFGLSPWGSKFQYGRFQLLSFTQD